jgi:hypothetical protein
VDRSPWPHVYRVTLRGLAGDELVVTALSWLGDQKAVVMAVEEHHRRGLEWPIYEVSTEDTGPAPREPDGLVGHGPPGYLEDRAEF